MGRSPTTQSSVHTREDLIQCGNNIHIKTKLKDIYIMPIHLGQPIAEEIAAHLVHLPIHTN